MKSIEVEAATIKRAIKIALDKLGTTKDKVIIDILREEKSGLFGMAGAHSAKIRARVKNGI